MCLTKKYKWPRITLRPKIVYKVLEKRNGKFFTPFMNYEVEINKKYKGKYNMFDTLFKTIKDDYVRSGFIHSYTDKESAVGNVVVECIIPRFTLYFIGRGNDIASRKIYYKSLIIDKSDKIIINPDHPIF